MSQRLIILHTNDIHGRVNGVARIATMVKKIRAKNPDTPVFYVDAGDSQDRSSLLSKKTCGVAMHRLLGLVGCQAATLGNKCMRHYPMEIVQDYAGAGNFPILLANLLMPDATPIPGTTPAQLFQWGDFKLGVIGVTADDAAYVEAHHLRILPTLPRIKAIAEQLYANGAHSILLLSHMGLYVDYQLASHLQNEVQLIIGGHTHNLLPKGRQVGQVHIAHAGDYASYLGRIDAEWDGESLQIKKIQVLELGKEVRPSPEILAEIKALRAAIKNMPEDR